MRTTQRLCAALLLLAALSCPSLAHNGKVAEAVPLADITIDGSLDDWPERMRMYPIAWVHPTSYKTEPPTGPDDFDARFTVGFDPKRRVLYVAVVVHDDDRVMGPGGGFTGKDLCEVYIDRNHAAGGPRDRSAEQYILTAGAVRPRLFGGDIGPSGVRGFPGWMGPVTVYEL